MQSGISASQELASQFGTLLESDRHFGLLVTIRGESLVPVEFLTPTGGGAASEATFGRDADALLVPQLQDKEAAYALLRRYDTAPRFVAATYVPDGAPVRQKMLFASTRLTLVRELGSEHFRETLFATTADELGSAGFRRHDAHTALAAPLTEEEESLGAVKRAEQEAGRGTATRETQLGKQFKMPLAADALAALRTLNDGKMLVILKINSATETVELDPVVGTAQATSVADVAGLISATEPRFTFFRYTHTHGGSTSSPLLFFYTCPATPGTKAIKFRMMYPLMKRAVLDAATHEAGLTLDHKFEVEDPVEITEVAVLADLHPQVELRKGFSRPRRPGR